MISVRDKIRASLGTSRLSVSDVVRITGLSQLVVSTQLSAMKTRTNEVLYFKEKGKYGKYELKSPPKYSGNIKQLELKLSQLNSNRERIRAVGVSLIDEIISDFEFFKSEFGTKS